MPIEREAGERLDVFTHLQPDEHEERQTSVSNIASM